MFFFAWLFSLVFCGVLAAAVVNNADDLAGWIKRHPLIIGELAAAVSFVVAWLLSRPKQ
jgi:hypothetical protein